MEETICRREAFRAAGTSASLGKFLGFVNYFSVDREGREWHYYTMTYDFICWEEEDIWSARIPSIPGVYGTGPTAEAAEADLREAMGLMEEYLEEIGEKLPAARKVHLGQVRI